MTVTQDFVPGQRYPLTMRQALDILRAGWPAAGGDPDLSRGRRFVEAPCSWEFWTTDGRKVDFSYDGHGLIVGQSREPDPERPEPLEG